LGQVFLDEGESHLLVKSSGDLVLRVIVQTDDADDGVEDGDGVVSLSEDVGVDSGEDELLQALLLDLVEVGEEGVELGRVSIGCFTYLLALARAVEVLLVVNLE
jgi:hypothetical protein